MSAATTLTPRHGSRHRSSFGGLVPSAAVARGDATTVAALGVELHADGAVLPLLVLSDNGGPLAVDTAQGVLVSDESGREYLVEECAQLPGLGSLQLDVWIAPAPPPDIRVLHVTVDGLSRTAITRRGEPVLRLLSEGPWELDVELVPPQTTAPVPPEPAVSPAPQPQARVPTRAFSTFEGIVPIGQARVADDLGVCLWALERYRDRAVLSLAVLAEAARGHTPVASDPGAVEMWDDCGRRYMVAPVHSSVRSGWSETTLEVVPAIGADVRALGVRVTDAAAGPGGPFVFGVSVSERPTG